MPSPADHPHAGQPLVARGPAPSEARVTVIAVHGRYGTTADILRITDALGLDDVAVLAPQAAARSWYPYSFLAPLDQNEPGLASALRVLGELVASLGTQGVPSERVALLGFSQGACLSLEFAARQPRRYAGVVALSGGLIGPPGTPRDYPGSLERTPAFIGCSDVDQHIPLDRVIESGDVYGRLGADVDLRIYPGLGHVVNDDELTAARALLRGAGR